MTMTQVEYNLNDIVEMRKEHPCAARSKLFKVVRLGADIKIQCLGCGNIVMLPRYKFNRRLKKVVQRHSENNGEQTQ